ncbi:protein TASOR 2 isoform X3 [Rhinolophus ferrumequinum]|uniref:protein TASOR 2 isoform X3 n=1 Tax=Rhinolophus ferrumequinum TaxID=59479 RepID=UPI00140F6E9D|nr:protein TASOR 2 isoform X3 [Rhinolophus ferrumequinum]
MRKKLNNPKFSAAATAQKTVFETVSLSSESLFQRAVSILHTSYLDSASEHGFQYSQVTLVKNDIFLNEYKTFYQEKKASNYTQEELQETYGFLLFETEKQAKLACQRGLCIGSSAITTLGDPAKGVYISRYSDCLHTRPWYHGKSGYIVIFNLIKYYLYELSGSTVTERPRQVHPYVIVAFQYREPKKMAAPAQKSILELSENVLISPWKGKLIIQGCLLCDITLWSSYSTVVPTQLPRELDFKYVMKVSSLKKSLPEAAFRKQNYLEQKVYCQDMCFSMYEVELSNKQGEKIDKLIEFIKNKQLAFIKCLEDRGVFLLLTSSALISETNFGDEQIGLHGLHLVRSSLSRGLKDLTVEDDISLKVIPILPALNCALLEAKKSFTEEGICPNTLVKRSFQELCKVDRSPSLTAASRGGMKETTFFGKLSSDFDLVPPAEKCPVQSLTQLKSYFSDPSGYILEVSTALDLLAEHPQSPCISDGICDAGFSLVMTPDPEFLDSEAEVRKETETEKNSEEMFKARKRTGIPLSPVSNVRIQPKRKASMPPVVPSKRVNLCRPFPKRTPGADKGSASQATLKLVKGQFPQKRKRGDLSVCVSLRSTDVDNRLKSRNGKNGAEVLTAQFVQTTKLDRKNQEAPISKDVPVATSAKRARKQKRSPVKTVPRAKPPVKKSPQKPRVHVVKGNKNPRIRKQPQSAQEETTSQLQSEIASDGQEDVLNINTVQPENITVAQKDPAENSIANCDSQALNLLADLALSAASSTAPSPEPRNLPHSSELPQNDILLSQEHSLSSASDHEYHRGVKRQKSELLPEPSSEKSNPTSDSVVSQEEESLVPGSEAPIQAQAALPEETLETGSASQSSFVAVEHSYALLLAEHSKKLLQQRGVPGPAFAKNGTKGPEAGTPVGKVMPFRHQQNTSPLQKLSEVPLLRRKSRLLSSSLRDAYCSHTVFSCDGSFKVTFKCETSYVFSLDSKYTNNPLEKTVLRALHGPWNTDLPDNLEEVKLLLHMWVALFYSNQSKVIRSSRKVVEHSNPAKYVSINSRIGSFEVSEIEESPSVERCTVGPLLETKEAPRGPSAEVSFPDTHSLLPFIKPQPARGLELWVQNEQKEIFAREGHPATPESQNFIYSYNNEVLTSHMIVSRHGRKSVTAVFQKLQIMEGKEQQSSDKLETSNLMLSSIGSTQTNGPSVPGEGKTFEPFDSTRMTSYDDTVTQTPFTTTCDGVSSQSGICQKSVYSTLESKVDIFHATVQGKTSSLQGLSQHNSPINKGGQPSLERKDDMGYVMINLEPVPLTFEKNACEPKQTEVVNRADKPTAFNVELIKQVSAGTSLRHPVSTFEKAQTQSLKDISSLAMSGQKGTKYLSASSVSGETLAKEMCLLQKEIPNPGLSSPSENSVAKEALPLVRSSNYSLPREEMKLPQEFFLQPKSLFSIPSEEIMEPSQAEEVPSSASATLEQNDSLNCILSRSNTSDHSLELKSDKSSLKSISRNFESFNSAFTKPTSRSINGEEISLELEDDADIDLTLTISPPTSPREEMPAGEIGQHQEAPLPNLALQDMDEDIIEPEEVTLIENREVNSAKYTSVLPTVSKKPLDNKERQGDNLQMVTLILPKETCALEIAEVNVTSDFPFGSLIEEVSPASSPDPQVPVEETQSCQSVSPCSLKLPDSQCEESKKFSQIESVDLAITEKENCFVGPTHPVGHDTLTRVQQMQLSAEMPLVLNNYPGRKDRHLTLPGKVSEETVPSENDESVSFSEKVPCCDTELNHPALTASYGADFKTSVEKLVIPGNLLQPISIENRNLDLKHLALETSEPPFSPRKIMENKSSADPLVSTTAPSGIVNMPLKQTSPKSIKKSLSSSELKTNESSYLQAQSLSSDSVGGAGVTEARTSSEVPKLVFSSGNGTVTHCTKPVNTERQFQTQEIPVVRMASLLNSETEAGLHEKTIDRGGFGSQSNSTSSPRGKQKSIPRLQDMLTCDTKDLLNGGLSPMYFHADSYQNTEVTNENTNKDPSAFFVAKSRVPLVYGVSEEQMGKKSTGQGLGAKKDSESLGGDMAISVNSDIRYEPLSGDSDQDYLGDCRNLKLDMEDSCTLRCSHTKKKEGATQDDYDSFLRLSNSDNEDWSYSNQVPGLETNTPSRNRSGGLKKEGKCLPRYIQIRDYHGLPWTYANFTVTKELKQTNQASHSLRKHPGYTAKCGLVSSWTDTWQVADNLTQNTLDLEYLRFDHKLKQIIKKGASQHSASSTVFLKESPLPLTKAAKSPVLRPTSRSRSPLVVTVMFSDAKQQSQHLTSHTPSNLESSSFWKERCDHSRNHLTNSERNQTAFHLNKLKYNSTLKESRSDISLILNEYAEFNKVMMNSNQVLFQDKGSDVASGEAVSQEMYSSSPRRSASYEDMITDLCASLHVKLKSVMKEACKSTFLFYLVETEDKSFFVRTKTLLRKGGHTEIEPEHFCQAFHRENDTLMVIIKNEDISSYLHQIPSLLKLKHFPSVLFAGVDSPEDVLNYTYQELFRTGGFVVSDDRILETLTLVQLKEIVKILEKLNGNGRWKWLLHYKENKKLKEDARVDSIAHKKNLILKSCQSANIIELLYYHQCDSRSSTKAEHFKCLLNLQMQHIHARFAVFLTEKPTLSREVFENSGILVTDVNNFIGNIQKVAAPFRSSYW